MCATAIPPQTNIVRVDGKRAIMMNILKTGSASTLDIIQGVRDKLVNIKGQLPPQLRINPLSDQSIFVRGAIDGVVREAIIAACLTAIMILVFLGSWRSTVIIAVSIPLSILCSLTALYALHETINIMTLGGMALAVGILVDDATVAIENINRNLEAGKELEQSILDGSAQIATPALVSTLAICIVFVPMFFLSGVARYLFVPMAEAVVFAMLASYLLSRTLVPTMAKYLLQEHDDAETARKRSSRNPFVRFQQGFESGFENFRHGYLRLLTLCVDHAGVFLILFLAFAAGFRWGFLRPGSARTSSPRWTPASSRFTCAPAPARALKRRPRSATTSTPPSASRFPPKKWSPSSITSALPYSGLNLSYSTSAPIGPADADIQVQLSRDHHPTAAYVERLRTVLGRQYPGVTFYVLPVDIVTQILNFGLSAPIDIQVVGPDLYGNRALAERMLDEVRYVPGAADARIQQPFNYPNMTVNVDRTRAQAIGLTQQNVAQSLLVALSGSFQTSPNFYLDPKNRRQLQRCHPVPAVPARLAGRAAEPACYREHAHGAGKRRLRARRGPCRRTGRGFNRRARSAAAGQCSGQPGRHRAGHGDGHREPLRRAAGHRYLRQRGWNRPGHGDPRDRRDHRPPPERSCRAARTSSCAGRARP